MRPYSPKRSAHNRKVKSVRDDYRDMLGIPFDAHRAFLPARTANFPSGAKDCGSVSEMQEWRSHWVGKPCWWCGEPGNELHHLPVAGMGSKKIQERWLFCWLCSDCHRHSGCAVTLEAMGRLLWLKWKWDRENVWWCGMAMRMGRHLPELEVD